MTLTTRRGRRAITLVEMMVAMALTLVIMLILSESFRLSLDFVRGANSTGQMMFQLNGAGTVMTRDLKAEHFLPETGKPNGGVRLSDQRADQAGWVAPRRGFFRIECPAVGVAATDGDGFDMRTATNHRLHFTAVLPGGTDSNLALTNVNGVTYRSRVEEVAYFLVQTGTTTPGGGQPLHDLIRRARLAAPTGEGGPLAGAAGDPNATQVISLRVAPPAADDDDDDGVVGNPPGAVNTLGNLRNAANRLNPLVRLPGPGPGAVNARYGEDILASNVLSFEVLADWSQAGQRTGATVAAPFPGNSDYPFAAVPGGVFDTATNPNIRIKQLRVTIRVYDPRTKQSRQSSFQVAM